MLNKWNVKGINYCQQNKNCLLQVKLKVIISRKIIYTWESFFFHWPAACWSLGSPWDWASDVFPPWAGGGTGEVYEDLLVTTCAACDKAETVPKWIIVNKDQSNQNEIQILCS